MAPHTTPSGDPVPAARAPLAAVGTIVGACLLMAATSAADIRLVTTVHAVPLPWSAIIRATVPQWIVFAVAMPIVLNVALRRPPWPFAWRRVALHAGLFLAITIVHGLVQGIATGGLVYFSGGVGFTLRAVRTPVNSAPLNLLLYSATLLAAWSIAHARERRERMAQAARLEAQLHAARLAALRAQLHPHFLYNTLNGIATLVDAGEQARASDALDQLADLLHAAFRDDGRDRIPLAEEIALVERYVALQRLRFGTRLCARFDVTPGAAAVLVPPLLLQPLVENAVIHGMAHRSTPMRLTVEAREAAGAVVIRVAHDGPVLPEQWTPAAGGVGIANTRDRLVSMFGATATRVVAPRAEGGVSSTITIPVSQAGAEAA